MPRVVALFRLGRGTAIPRVLAWGAALWLFAAAGAGGEPRAPRVDLAPVAVPSVLPLGTSLPATVRVTNREPGPFPTPGPDGKTPFLRLAWQVVETPEGPPAYASSVAVPPLAPGETRLVSLHLGGVVRPGWAWLRVRPFVDQPDAPPVEGRRLAVPFRVVAPPDVSPWVLHRPALLDALRLSYVLAMAGVALAAAREMLRRSRKRRA